MDTLVTNNGTKKENAKETLKKGATLVGAAGLGAGAVVSVEVVRGDENIDVVEPISPLDVAEATTNQEPEREEAKVEETSGTNALVNNVSGGHHTSTVTEPQPQESPVNHADNSTVNVNPTPVHEGEIDTNDIPDVDPRLVAQDITDDVIMVDPTDNDMGSLDIAAVGSIETVDGQVLSAAQFTGENGETLYAVDVDGDNTYDVVTDASGNVLAEVPSTLTVSDSENIVSVNNGESGYLAQNEQDEVSEDGLDNPMDDVIDLG